MPQQDAWASYVHDVKVFLQGQQEYGLEGVDVSPECLLPAEQVLPSAVQSSQVPAAHVQDLPQDLPAVQRWLGACTRCGLCHGRTSVVFGTGNPQARLMFVGEGPGRDEDLQGEPFVGEAGKLLDKMIVAMGLRRSAVYIANVVKCRPPRNRDPEPEEIAACEPFLQAQIRVVKPAVLVALGRVAAQSLLKDTTPISRLRGQWKSYEGIPLMPTFHPAYLLRNPKDKKWVWSDLQAVMGKMGLPLPAQPQK
jgi:uracil-DNA glycosylase family 4